MCLPLYLIGQVSTGYPLICIGSVSISLAYTLIPKILLRRILPWLPCSLVNWSNAQALKLMVFPCGRICGERVFGISFFKFKYLSRKR
jgi:hypothetical protein